MRPPARWPAATYVLGVAALFSGIALLLSILLAFSLPVGLVVFGAVGAGIGLVLMRRAPAVDRHSIRRIILAGLLGGVAATISYDVSRALLSALDPVRYNPLLAIDAFGALLLGDDAPASARLLAGSLFHLLNGTAFGVAYCLFFGRLGAISVKRGLLTGIGWGLFLEGFQLTLFPGWLDIRAVQDFAVISGASHIVYGVVLGLTCRAMLIRHFSRTPRDAR